MSDASARTGSLDVLRQILLQAPAGSGKTTVLAQRFLSALAVVEEPEEVLAITFTRKAAAEMRERVLLALEDALPESQPDRAGWQALRSAVLARAGARGWSLAELPQRLRIQTIDSLAAEIARAMPLLGRLQTSLAVVDDAVPLYREAAREALRHGEADADYRADVELLLLRLDNKLDDAQQLLAEMLPGRNRWQPWLMEHSPQALAERVAASLTRIVGTTLDAALRTLSPSWWQEAAALAGAAAGHREAAGHEEGPWRSWLGQEGAPDPHPSELIRWQAIAALVLTTEGEPRTDKGLNARQGMPASEKALKSRWIQWKEEAASREEALEALRTIQQLPPALIDADERQALAALARVMLLAAAQLKLVFREHGLVDHAEVAAIARQALHGAQGLGEDVLRHTLRVSHLLVDEFQDTSPEQLELVQALTSGWEQGEARSLFLVGDPMQSIYLFRDSEVGLFLRTRAGGVGDIRLEALQLTRNFRSQPGLVGWVNRVFARIFPRVENLRSSAVTFLPAEAARAADERLQAEVRVWPQPEDDAVAEAAMIAAEIAGLRAARPDCSIAVLVQKRALAGPILRALRETGTPVVGVDLATLAERPVVRDLVALGQALLDAGDRVAWLAVLRAPACGLLLADLLRLGELVGPGPVVERLEDPAVLEPLSADATLRLRRVAPLLVAAWRGRGSLDIASLIENTWQQLGGEAACRDPSELAVARQYLLALRGLLQREGRVEPARLAELAARLRDRGEAAGANPVEVLTIHHAKGLEWDAVFVPGLGVTGAADRAPLLRSLELPAPDGGSDLLLAVRSLGEPNSSDPLAKYIGGLRSERLHNERLRLLYVAVTRARFRLYLSGHAPPDKAGEPRPASRSLLSLLWPAIREEFPAVVAAGSAQTAAPAPQRMIWQRLPASFELPAASVPPTVHSLARAQTEEGEKPEYSWVGPLARAAGTVLHAELERLALLGEAAAAELPARVEACAAGLREHGIATEVALRTARDILQRLQVLVRDERARWLLFTPQREASSELRLSGIVAGELRNVVIDRSFIDAAGTRWIVDYKTGRHAGGGLAEFISSELERYAPQLRLYRELLRGLGPEPVRAALYFPWLGEFRELPLQD